MGYVAYVAATGQWLFLLALPAFVLAYWVYTPSSVAILGPVRGIAIAAAFVGLLVSVVLRGRGFAAAFAVLVIEWLSFWSVYRVCVDALLRAVVTHDDMFERFWNGGIVGIRLADGTRHWANRKHEAGHNVRLE